ncbi:PLP-dependent transferase [Exidia glandulosa HHB12029]|uniref:PLP-dependent transferase n=1 Tax=Exidia glandulosa HHB12029 TaxID=1314781 RepID=A0A166B3D1_EXIGL|nr:PLP-dependent transferase [Exidia glandulosa HHB12029]
MSSTLTLTFAAGTHPQLQLNLNQGAPKAASNNDSAVVAGDSEHAIDSHEPGKESDSTAATDLARARTAFLNVYPGYATTSALDDLRATEYTRLKGGETYVDYMGGALFPESLVRDHAKLLLEPGNLFGNAHSRSESSHRSSELAYAARMAILNFLDADKDEYTVIFTPNATGALKMVGEAFPFEGGGSVILPADAHNSVHGIRVFAETKGAEVKYYGSGPRGGVDLDDFKSVLSGISENGSSSPSLVVITGQSNVTSAKAPLAEMLSVARANGSKIYTLLDAAALAPTSIISLRKTPVDACAVSFYKICGYPTGLGALIVKRTFSRNVMRRVWFAGGTVTAVQVPGSGPRSYQLWEDGTLNYLGIPAIRAGLALVSCYRKDLPERLTILTHYLSSGLERVVYANGAPLVHIVSTLPDLAKPGASGSAVSCIFLNSTGTPLRNDVVERSARRARIALRTGCMCNPGAVFGLLHLSGRFATQHQEAGELLFKGDSSFGLVRISLGIASNFEDVWRVLNWAERDVTALGRV